MELSARGLLTVDDPGLAEIGSVSQDTLVHGGVVARAEGQGEMVADDWPWRPPPVGNGQTKRRGSISNGGMGVVVFFQLTARKTKNVFLLLFCLCFCSSASQVDGWTRRGLKLECVSEKQLLTLFTKHVGAQHPGGRSALKTVNGEADGCDVVAAASA